MPSSHHKFPTKTNSRFFSISMASFFSLSFLFLFLLLSSASSRHSLKSPKSKQPLKSTAIPPEIIQACKATRFPDTCQSSLTSIPQNPTPLQIIQSAIDASSTNLKTAQSMVKSILASSAGNPNRTTAAKNCIEVLDNSQYRLSSTGNALPVGKNKDARAWMSAALLYQYDCSNALKYANDTAETNKTMSFLDSLMMLTSNALSMVMAYDIYGNSTGSWSPPKTERNGFWVDSGSGDDLGFRGGFPSKLTADVTVCKDGSGSSNGCYKTVQEAVNAAPDDNGGDKRKFVIHITEGVYDEIVRIPLQKKNVVFIGDGIGKTVITGSSTVGQIGISTYNTATLESTKPFQLVEPKPRLKFKSLIFVVLGLVCFSCIVVAVTLFTPHRKHSSSVSNPPKPPSETVTPQAETPEPPPREIVPVAQVKLACKATRYPKICESSLIDSTVDPSNPIPLQIIQSALSLSYNNLTSAQSMLKSILVSEAGNPNITRLAKSCLEIIGYSQYRMSKSNETLPMGDTKNARAWMSAAVAYQYDCYGGLAYHGGNTTDINQTRSYLNTSVTLGSNALSMMISYDLFGNETSSWQPPKTERDRFWEGTGLSTEMGFSGGFPSKLKADATVCKDGSGGCYKTVQEAVDAAPNNTMDKKFVIHIKTGVYGEIVRIVFEKKNVVFLGDGIGKSVITGSLSVAQPGVTTYESATVGVLGDGFMASGLTIQNTAGAPTHQAVAFRSDSDLSFVENCEFIGNQDTLYAHSLRQYYKSCRIQGNVDFIFGNSAAIFQDCEILVSPRLEKPEHGENNAVTAHGRTDPAQSTGFVFQNCLINGTEKYMELYRSNPSVHKNYLGRPWKEYSRVVFIDCDFEALIAPEGWMPWSGDFALKTLYYGEFENKGPGSNLSQRVAWSSRIPKEHVHTYSVQNFIQGDEWIPTSS